MSEVPTTAPVPLLLVAVPTYRRPRMLTACLESLRRQEAPQDVRVELLVVDNDPEGSARPVLAALGEGACVHYVLEPSRGLSSVRNRILQECRERGAAWLAGIDDDEIALPDWLLELWQAQCQHAADIVCGPVIRIRWGEAIPDAATLRARVGRADGHSPRRVASGNALLRLAALGEPPQRFDTGLNLSGGEDHEFFERLRSGGARAVWAARAVAVEWLPPTRQGLRYTLWRHFSDGASGVARARAREPAWRVGGRYGLKAAGKLCGALLALLRLPIRPRRASVDAAIRLANALGLLAGLLGFRVERYRHPDGF